MSEVRFDCHGLGLVARNEASILVFDTKPVLYRPVLDQIQFCSFDRGCKTCLDTKPVLDQGRFCSLTYVSRGDVIMQSLTSIAVHLRRLLALMFISITSEFVFSTMDLKNNNI